MMVVVVEFSMLKRKNPVASDRNGLPRVWSRHGIADREPMTASAITLRKILLPGVVTWAAAQHNWYETLVEVT
jgi:hypothetical protein